MREVFIQGWSGANRTGKSIEASKVAKHWKENNPKGQIIAFDPQNRFTEYLDFKIDVNTPNWADIVAEMTNVLLILDDFKKLYPGNQANAGIMNLMANRSEHGIDIIYICHNPADILEIFTKFTNQFCVFYTNTKTAQIKAKIPNNPELYEDAVNYINMYIDKYGRTEYPNPFPFVVANIETNELKAVNFKHKL